MAVTRKVIMELGAKQAASMKQSFGAMRGGLKGIRGAAKKLAAVFFSIKGIIIGALVRGAFRMLRNALQSVTSAAVRQEDAVMKLNSALRIAGIYTSDLSKKTQDFASAIQQQTKYGDEAVLEMQALLVTYGVMPEQLERATKAAVDFAARSGRSLTSAALLVGKAAAGFTGELTRYGIIIKTEGIAKTEVFTRVLRGMEKMFGGSAQAEARTYAGRVKQVSDAWGDFLEKLGDIVIKSPVVLQYLRDMKERFETWGEYILENLPEIRARFESVFGQLVGILESYAKTARDTAKATLEMARGLGLIYIEEPGKGLGAARYAKYLKEQKTAAEELAKAVKEKAAAERDAAKAAQKTSQEYSKQVQSMARQFGLMSSLEKAQVRFLAEQLKGARGFEFFQRMTEAQREMVGRSRILAAITEKKGYGERAAEEYLGKGFLSEVEKMQQVNVQAQIKSEIEVKMMLDAQAVAKKFLESVYPRIQQAVLTATNALSQKWEQMQLGNREATKAAVGPSP